MPSTTGTTQTHVPCCSARARLDAHAGNAGPHCLQTMSQHSEIASSHPEPHNTHAAGFPDHTAHCHFRGFHTSMWYANLSAVSLCVVEHGIMPAWAPSPPAAGGVAAMGRPAMGARSGVAARHGVPSKVPGGSGASVSLHVHTQTQFDGIVWMLCEASGGWDGGKMMLCCGSPVSCRTLAPRAPFISRWCFTKLSTRRATSARAIDAAAASLPSGLYVVSTPIGNLQDASPRVRSTLQHCSRILCENVQRTRVLLAHLGVDTPMESFHEHNEDAKLRKVNQAWACTSLRRNGMCLAW